MEWLRTQITMTEVNVARVHNFAVLKREQARAVSGTGGFAVYKDFTIILCYFTILYYSIILYMYSRQIKEVLSLHASRRKQTWTLCGMSRAWVGVACAASAASAKAQVAAA